MSENNDNLVFTINFASRSEILVGWLNPWKCTLMETFLEGFSENFICSVHIRYNIPI